MGEGATQVASACRLVAAVGICAIASGRCLVLASWTPLFDLDPALTADLPTAIGPATGVGLDIIVLVLCGVGLWGEAGRGRGLQRRLLLLGAAGSGVVLWHGLQDPAHLWHGGAWIAAIFAAITLSHLARGRHVAVLAPAILCAVAAPLVIREAIQWLIEHPDTIDWFKEHRSDALALRGLTPDTPQAALLEERLMAAEPAAWFSSPNVLAAVLSALAATWLGWARAAAWRLEGGWPVAAILIAAACGSGALLTGAKSAPLLLAIAGGLLVLCSCNVTRTLLQRRGGLVAIALIAAAIGVVTIRGVLGADAIGERSLLVRAAYQEGGMEIAAAAPLTGAGPAGLQDAWLLVRPAEAAEEITSTHNVLLDWIAAAGAGGACWCVVILLLAWRSGRSLGTSEATRESPPQSLLTGSIAATVAVAAVIALPDLRSVDAADLLVRCLALAAMGGLVWIGAGICGGGRARWAMIAVGLGGVLLAVAGQVDIIFFDTGAALWACCLLGVAAALPGEQREGGGGPWALLPAAAAIALTLVGWVPLASSSSRQGIAAAILRAYGPSARDEAVDVLSQPGACVADRLLAARQAIAAGDLAAAWDAIEPLPPSPSVLRMRASLAPTLEASVMTARALVEVDPQGLESNLLLADAIHASGSPDEARAIYQRVLELDAARIGDPLRRLSPSDRARVTVRSE